MDLESILVKLQLLMTAAATNLKRAKMTPKAATTTTADMPIPKNVHHDETMNNISSLRIKKLSENSRAPERASGSAAGYDLFSPVDAVIPAKGKALISTEISLAIPEGYYGRVAPRSGLAVKHSIDVGAGVIDSDYRGPLGIVLFNFGEADFAIKKNDRIAQLIITKIITPPVEVVEDLDDTRGVGGFGSTGK